jgi:periplasmic protein TonB
MFEDSLLESGNRFRSGKRAGTTLLSFVLQILLLCVLILIPLIYTEALPKQQLMTFLVAPPPPPPPPPPAAATPVKVVKAIASDLDQGQLRTPTKIPQKVAMIKEEEAPPPTTGVAGVVGGVPGGVPGGQMGGVIGGIISSVPTANVPKIATPQRVRVSQGVSQGLLIHQVKPNYPPLARQARIQGSVVLQAVIAKNGAIENLHLVSGHPMLAPAAIEAVKQWKYKPYFLNGEPVEVETQITVNFTLAGG